MINIDLKKRFRTQMKTDNQLCKHMSILTVFILVKVTNASH